MPKTKVELIVNGREVPIRLSLTLKGTWRTNDYKGEFWISDRRFTLKISSSSLFKALIRRKGLSKEIKEVIESASKLLGISVRIEGPLSLKVYETS